MWAFASESPELAHPHSPIESSSGGTKLRSFHLQRGERALRLEQSGRLVEELLLPVVEQRQRDRILLAAFQDRPLLGQVELEDADLLFRREIASFSLGHLRDHGRADHSIRFNPRLVDSV